MRIPASFEPAHADYQRRHMGGRVGFGSRPALLVVDMQRGFTDLACPLAMELSDAARAISALLVAARAGGHLVLFSTLAFKPDLSDAGVMAVKGSQMELLSREGPWIAIDPRIGPLDGEVVFEKRSSSCFFDTDLLERLRTAEIDTLVVTGCTTSGCVRATVVDASAHGFHTVVVEEAVGDRTEVSHFSSLVDMDAKYGDVIDLATAVAYLGERGTGRP
jgi:maleamate amidohydrolase